MFSAAKLFFAYGLGNSMNFPLNYGACTVLSDERPTPEMTFRIIEKYKPTIYFGVPTLYAAQCRALETESPDLSSIRISVSAGESLPAPIFERWREKVGHPPVDGIGSTEGTHILFLTDLRTQKPAPVVRFYRDTKRASSTMKAMMLNPEKLGDFGSRGSLWPHTTGTSPNAQNRRCWVMIG